MKYFAQIYDRANQFRRELLLILIASLFSAFVSYQFIESKIPKIAVVDLRRLNDDFAPNLARYFADKKASEEEMTQAVKLFLDHQEALLKEINKKGNYVLLQKQTVVSEGLIDITDDLKKVLFESVTSQMKKGEKNEKTQ